MNLNMFKRGVVLIKGNYNLKDYPEEVTKVWYPILRDKLSDAEYERCIAVLIDTVPNWYQAGESLASRVLAVLPQVRDRLRSERERLEQTTPPKELPMSEDERRRNLELLSESWKKTLSKLQMPRVKGESTSDRTERISREVEEEMSRTGLSVRK